MFLKSMSEKCEALSGNMGECFKFLYRTSLEDGQRGCAERGWESSILGKHWTFLKHFQGTGNDHNLAMSLTEENIYEMFTIAFGCCVRYLDQLADRNTCARLFVYTTGLQPGIKVELL